VTTLSESRLRRGNGVLAKPLKANEPALVLLNPQSGEYYTLDEVGSRVWQLLDGTRTVLEIVAVIIEEYEAAAEVIERDVLDLLKDLVDEQLVVGAS
jgi:Coenzyme PQQ synthesis protein D (PqqD)